MTTTLTPKIGAYHAGDLSHVRSTDPFPFEDWPGFTERNAHDLRSIRIGDLLVGCCGYFIRSRHEANAFAVIDRMACAGHGLELARIARQQQLAWMEHLGVTIAYADCPSNDRAAQVFLRAIGYRPIHGDEPGTSFFALTWSK